MALEGSARELPGRRGLLRVLGGGKRSAPASDRSGPMPTRRLVAPLANPSTEASAALPTASVPAASVNERQLVYSVSKKLLLLDRSFTPPTNSPLPDSCLSC
jgi:hypothetical protein